MTTVTLEGTQELMKHRDVAVILATGGMGLVRAAYSAGKPAYGVGPGNAPAFIERTADVKKAVRDVVTGKTFDNGVLCSSENSVVVDEPIADDGAAGVRRARAATSCRRRKWTPSRESLVTPQRLPNPAARGQVRDRRSPRSAASAVPAGTRVLIAPSDTVWGVVFDLDDGDLASLDADLGYRGSRDQHNVYDRELAHRRADPGRRRVGAATVARLRLRRAAVQSVAALAPYLETVVRGARHHRLPDDYVAVLGATPTRPLGSGGTSAPPSV